MHWPIISTFTVFNESGFFHMEHIFVCRKEKVIKAMTLLNDCDDDEISGFKHSITMFFSLTKITGLLNIGSSACAAAVHFSQPWKFNLQSPLR